MSGVRNLRAMFEQKGENNPPDRGRSPGPGGLSVGSPSPSHSPRPLSKVRTTFVAIEKDGRVGLRREHSGDSISVSSRRFSNETEATTPQPALEKTDVFAENMAKNTSSFKTNLLQEAIPESPKLDALSKLSAKKDSQSSNMAPNPNPDKFTDEEETKTKLLPGDPKEEAATRGNGATFSGRIGGPTTNSKSKTGATTKSAPKAAPKAAPVSTTAKPVSKALKSPNTLKPANNTTKASASSTGLAPNQKAPPTSSNSHDTSKKTAPAAAKATVTSGKKPAPIDLPPPGTGFVKPKPKSPTRPVKLPASLTAPTAAYASKLGPGNTAHPPRQSLSRASGNAQHLNMVPILHRSPSRASVSTTGTLSNAKGLKRQSSTINRPRPSIGPPPKQTARDHPLAKRESHVDEGFLARMMRPTQSSSSKTAEKAPVTPPRKQSAPSTVLKKPIANDAEGSARKAAAKIQASTNKAKTATDTVKPAAKEAVTAKEVAPVVAQTETAEAAIETAKVSTETVATSGVEKMGEPIAASVAEETAEETVATGDVVEESPKPVATVPTITEDPDKVEDIEDLVQANAEESFDQKPTGMAPEGSNSDKEELKEVQVPQPISEPSSEVAPVDDETITPVEDSKPEGLDVEEPKTEEVPETDDLKADDSTTEKEEEVTVEDPPKESTRVEDVQVHEAKSEIPSEDV